MTLLVSSFGNIAVMLRRALRSRRRVEVDDGDSGTACERAGGNRVPDARPTTGDEQPAPGEVVVHGPSDDTMS